MNADSVSRAHLTDDELLDLVNGFLDEPSRASAITHASRCTECDARLKEFAAVHELGRARAGEVLGTDAGRGPVRVLEPPDARRSSASSRKVQPAALLAAAAVIVAAGVFVFISPRVTPPSPAERARHEWLPRGDAFLEGRRGEGSADDSIVSEGIAAYERRDLATVERLLTPPIAALGPDWVRRLYLANTFVATGRNAEAVNLIGDFRADYLPEPWRGELQWTLLVALAGAHQPAAADSVLRVLEGRRDAIGDRARRLSGARP